MQATQPRLKLFFFSRALSTFGDEVWAMAIPLFFALAGFTSEQMGSYYSVYAMGTIVAFVIFPHVASRVRVGSLAIAIDVFQFVLFSGLAIWLVSGSKLSLLPFTICGLLLGAAGALWFAASETLATQLIDKSAAQSFHRLNFLSTTMGPLLAPLAASTLFVTIGLFGIAIFNAVSFLPQITALASMNRPAANTRVAKKGAASSVTMRQLFAHPHYGPLVGVTTFTKVGLLGLLPFIPFVFAKSGLNIYLLGFAVAAFSLGSVIGAVLYKPRDPIYLGRSFRLNTISMFTATALIVVSLKVSIIWLVPFLAMTAGVACARYSIELRSMRQLISPPEHMPSLVSLQGLFARVITPASGALYGLLYAEATGNLWSVAIGVVIALCGISFSMFAARGYEQSYKP